MLLDCGLHAYPHLRFYLVGGDERVWKIRLVIQSRFLHVLRYQRMINLEFSFRQGLRASEIRQGEHGLDSACGPRENRTASYRRDREYARVSKTLLLYLAHHIITHAFYERICDMGFEVKHRESPLLLGKIGTGFVNDILYVLEKLVGELYTFVRIVFYVELRKHVP